jgi:nucleoside-triphosphatase THEP1
MGNVFSCIRVAVCGERGCGKTSMLMDLVKALRNHGLTVKGTLEAGIFEGDEKVAIEVMDLAAGESRLLARSADETITELQFGDWTFYTQAFDWANERLAKMNNMDVFVLDEIGPLELNQGCGLQAGLDVMAGNNYNMGIVTVRPKCLEALVNHFPDLTVYSLPLWEGESLINELLRIAIRILDK